MVLNGRLLNERCKITYELFLWLTEADSQKKLMNSMN